MQLTYNGAILGLLLFFVPLLVGQIAIETTQMTITNLHLDPMWIRSIKLPVWHPDPNTFAPIWTALYVLMGISAVIVFNQWYYGCCQKSRYTLIFFLLHLTLNFYWSVAYFGLQSLLGGLVVITMLLFSVFYVNILFFDVNWIAGLLVFPYLLFVLFASTLNAQVYMLNSRV